MVVHARGIQHIGVPVKSLERSLAFYRDAFGLEPDWVHTAEPRPDLSDAVGVPDARLTFAFLQLGNTFLELLEYHTPRDETYGRMNCDVGAVHVCFEVDDIHAAYEELSAKGIEFYSPPFYIDNGPLTDYWFVYFKDPDGITLELFQLPK